MSVVWPLACARAYTCARARQRTGSTPKKSNSWLLPCPVLDYGVRLRAEASAAIPHIVKPIRPGKVVVHSYF
ncbi:hypothetical protein BANE1_60 [Mycobacterium phage Bane1]|uniref:Uncharacterized protein n=2 Tax=Coopervirus bane1 TaxID=1983109 RepID=T2A9J6_9CAUD|nr:hypothetical protein BANE1_60 [Mycobacterium phage Bane1]AGU92099.1 hypothetical protein BANE1_60 [Mycobacterium phage Bane1]AGU92207.1 hypothetical protein BANE2_60 [Mycobacterium phage Bane2]